MKLYFKTILFFLMYMTVFSQQPHPYVTLKEKVNGKRVQLFAVNTDSISYSVFLRVETQDYRRSSARPLIKIVPPFSEVPLITLVKLKGKEGKYSTAFVVNKNSNELNMQKSRESFKVRFDKALKEKKIFIYTKEVCSFCDESKGIFRANNIGYTEYCIDDDNDYLIKLNKELKAKNYKEKVSYPIIKVEDSLYTKISTKQDLFNIINNHY